MSPEKQRIAIAEACGWVWYRHPVASSLKEPYYKFLAFPAAQEFEQSPVWMVRADGSEKPCSVDYMAREFHLPDYLNDLNAMHDAAMSLRISDPLKYVHYAAAITSIVAKHNSDLEDDFSISTHDATATQRAEAFLRTLGKWEDDSQ